MSVKLLAKQHWEFLSFKGGCTGSSESTLVKLHHCCKSHIVDLLFIDEIFTIEPTNTQHNLAHIVNIFMHDKYRIQVYLARL